MARWPVLAVISIGGASGALARYGLLVAFPTAPGGFGWATFWTNVSGCLLIGVLMAFTEDARPLLRPFLGVGVLGGFTTFSTYVLDIQQADSASVGLAYLAATVVGALLAVWIGAAVGRALRRRP